MARQSNAGGRSAPTGTLNPGRLTASSRILPCLLSSFFAGDLTDARALSVRALELARRLDDPEALHLAAFAFIVGAPIQDEEERWRLVKEMAAHPHVGVPAHLLGAWLYFSATACMDWGDRARAEGMDEELSQLAERTHDVTLIVRSLLAPCRSAFLDGRLEEAVSALKHLIDRAEELGAPVIGCGGIENARDALEYLLAGARALQVGTANFYDPMVMPKIIDGIRDYLAERGCGSVEEIIGKAHEAKPHLYYPGVEAH